MIKVLLSVPGLLLFSAGCAGFPPADRMSNPEPEPSLEQELGEIDRSIRDCLETGDYHGAIRLLPKEAALWDELITETGKSYEGAEGFFHASVMGRAAALGDLQWGSILDDPEVPYRYKTLLVFEILETRLGKGSVYRANESNLIVPVPRRVAFDKEERFQLPEGMSAAPGNEPKDAPTEASSLQNTSPHTYYRQLLETKYTAPLDHFEVIRWSATTQVLWFDWQRRWWGSFNVIETTPAGDPLYWYDIPQPPTAQSIERIRIVTLADQPFLEVIDRTHMGNGFLHLYEIRDGFVRLKLSARVRSNLLTVEFDPAMAEIEYRDTGGEEPRLIVQAECFRQSLDGSEGARVGRYYREFVLERGDFRERRDKRMGPEELMD